MSIMQPCSVLLAVLACLAHGCFARVVLESRGRALQQCEQPSYQALLPTTTRAPVVDLQWLDRDDQNVLAITKRVGLNSGGLWLSTDGGRRWKEQTSLLNASLPVTETTEVVVIFKKKSDPRRLTIIGQGSYYWVSSDYGNTFTARRTPNGWRGSGIKSYKLHPTRDDWILFMVKRPNCRVMDKAAMDCPYDLIYSTSLFADEPTWGNLTAAANGKIAGFVDFDWGSNLCKVGDCQSVIKVKEETIMATMYARPGDYDQIWDPDVHYVRSDTFFTTFSTQVKCGNMFEIIGKSVYLAMANSCPTDINGNARPDKSTFPQGISLYTSEDGGATFTQACLPVALKQEGYELVETHDGTGAIVIVNFLINNNLPASSVYTAGPHHALFSLSLTDVYHADSYSTDFAKIDGLPGVYIANQMVPRPSNEETDYYSYYDLGDAVGKPMVETRITFNGGGRWERIPAPTTFNNEFCNRCDNKPDCYLHLHGMSSWDTLYGSMPAVYSNPSAPGLIMASGNVGIKGIGLDDTYGLCTWLSTDGGVSWQDVAVGAFIYEYADWGGFIVMGRYPGSGEKAAEEVMFSFDGGKCWHHVPLATAMLLDNIRIEPDGQRPRVILHGRACSKAISEKCTYEIGQSHGVDGLMYMVDMQELLADHNIRMPTCDESAYVQWAIPSDLSGSGARCVLGRKTYIQRRKFEARCFNGGAFKRQPPVLNACNCSAEADLECDYGYMKNAGKCVALPESRMAVCPAIVNKLYTVSKTGKRLVHADTCVGVDAILSDTDGKGGATPESGGSGGSRGKAVHHSSWFGFTMFLIGLVVASAGFTGWWVYLASENQRDTVRDLAGGTLDFLVSLKDWAKEKMTGRRYSSLVEHDMGYFQPLGDAGNSEDETKSLFTLR